MDLGQRLLGRQRVGQQRSMAPSCSGMNRAKGAAEAAEARRQAEAGRGTGSVRRTISRCARSTGVRSSRCSWAYARNGVRSSPYSTPDGHAVWQAWQPRQLSM
jgi:hypothetical protein